MTRVRHDLVTLGATTMIAHVARGMKLWLGLNTFVRSSIATPTRIGS